VQAPVARSLLLVVRATSPATLWALRIIVWKEKGLTPRKFREAGKTLSGDNHVEKRLKAFLDEGWLGGDNQQFGGAITQSDFVIEMAIKERLFLKKIIVNLLNSL
jgi:hypothetical protein